MNRYLQKCPQCGSMECGPWRCRFTMIEHRNAVPQATPDPGVTSLWVPPPADAAFIGYESAWPFHG